MKICILTPRYPFPENGGDVLRINGVARYLKKKKHTLILLSFIENTQQSVENDIYDKEYTVSLDKKKSYANCLKSFFTGEALQISYYESLEFDDLFNIVIQKECPDLYIAHLLRMVPYLYRNDVVNKSIVEMTDALSKTYARAKEGKGISIKKFVYLFEKERIAKYEKKVISDYKKVVLVSEADKTYLGGLESLHVYPNGTGILDVKNDNYNPKKLVFIGNMSTLQNQDAVIFFVQDIFPKILEKDHEVEFWIVGSKPSRKIRNLADEKNIFVTGFVKDIYREIEDACLSIAPVRIAAGIQNKVLLAMSASIPVILSDVIAEGIVGLRNHENCVVAKEIEEYVYYIEQIMNNAEERKRISEAGYELIKNNYSWESMLEGYEQIEYSGSL